MKINRTLIPRRWRALAKAQDGATIIEFALISPALMVLLLGSLDIGHTLYMQSVLQGAVQKAARDGTMEVAAGTSDAARDAIDQAVQAQLGKLNHSATITITRRFYKTFSKAAAAQAESHSDTTAPSDPFKDGKCNNGETFVDANNNGKFDRDGGDSINNAGARDNVVYTVNVSYPRMFPLHKLVGASSVTSLTARTVLSNQPYGDQSQYGPPTDKQCGGGSPGLDAQPGEPYA